MNSNSKQATVGEWRTRKEANGIGGLRGSEE